LRLRQPGTTTDMHDAIWLAGLLIIPGLFLLALLMSWMETRLTQHLVEDDVTRAWHSSTTPEEVEEMVQRSVSKLMIDRTAPIYVPSHSSN
jgi:hypothetical protein